MEAYSELKVIKYDMRLERFRCKALSGYYLLL